MGVRRVLPQKRQAPHHRVPPAVFGGGNNRCRSGAGVQALRRLSSTALMATATAP